MQSIDSAVDSMTSEELAEALAGRIVHAAIEAADLATVYQGNQPGFYRAPADGGAATP